MGVPDQVVKGLIRNSAFTTIPKGAVVRFVPGGITGVNEADVALSPGFLGGLIGIANNESQGGSGTQGGVFLIVTNGAAKVLCEPGLTLACGDPLYVSEITAGRATNVAPALAVQIGVVNDATAYGVTGDLVDAVLTGGGQSNQGARGALKFSGFTNSTDPGYMADGGHLIAFDVSALNYPVPACVVTKLLVKPTFNTSPAPFTVTLYKNNAPTALFVSVVPGTAVASNYGTPISFADQDLLDLYVSGITAGEGVDVELSAFLEIDLR